VLAPSVAEQDDADDEKKARGADSAAAGTRHRPRPDAAAAINIMSTDGRTARYWPGASRCRCTQLLIRGDDVIAAASERSC